MTKQSLNKDNFAVVLTGGEKSTTVLSAMKDAGWLEFRVDEFLEKFPEKNLASSLSVKGPFKKIGTVRWKKEHQSRGLDIPEKKRLEIYEKIAGGVDYMDVEIRSKIAGDVAGLEYIQNLGTSRFRTGSKMHLHPHWIPSWPPPVPGIDRGG